MTAPPLLRPAWAAPRGVAAAMSLRDGGVSGGRWASLNTGLSVGDEPAAVAENRARYAAAVGVPVHGLRQVHGTRVVRLRRELPAGASAADVAAVPSGEWGGEGAAAPALAEADAAWTTEPALACTVGAADCLPVLLALRDGSAVAAAHAGWRGLAAGVVEATVAAVCDGTGAAPDDLCAWLGPCIGPAHFEVGAEVRAAFVAAQPDAASHFAPRRRADGSAAWLADLPALARRRLAAAGVRAVSASGLCTVADASRFFSHRRDGVTGRHAASVWRA